MTKLAFHSLTRELLARARRGQGVDTSLAELAPALHAEIAQASAVRATLAFWARSRNVDELVGAPIVEPEILAGLGALARVPMRGAVVHAGVQHTYAYLLSNRRTPYGMKRTRWVAPALERGFGLRPRALRPLPRGGTLLTNLTWFLGQIALADLPVARARLRRLEPHVAPQLLTYPFARLQVTRITETVRVPTPRMRAVSLVTDLVALPHPPRAGRRAPHALLVYSVREGTAPPRLVTAFPIDRATWRATLALPRGAVEIRARYNLFVAGLSGKPRPGRRSRAMRKLLAPARDRSKR